MNVIDNRNTGRGTTVTDQDLSEVLASLSPEHRERVIKELLELQAVGLGEKGLPESKSGDIQGWNNLRRTNWFNGRYLTAESLERQAVYFDARARLGAQAQMPGIAWGLGLQAPGANRTQVAVSTDDRNAARGGGLPMASQIVLQRGLAFDYIGRPILVSAPFGFTLEQLIGTYRKAPQRVVGGGTDFSPCVCLAPDPSGSTGGDPLAPTGPYLLIIEAAESPEGEAKIIGDLCAGPRPDTCNAESWRGGFGLSLVRFPVDLPLRDDLMTAWDLRGTLSAYYHDVFEHPLWRRWDPAFATDGGFCEGTGPGRHDGAAVALGMLYLAEDDTASFIDQWIPRRTICDTPGEDWHRTRFGAPPRAAAWGRIHQFQCMLAESLEVLPMDPQMEIAPLVDANLYQRGFRHIPPIGFLPVEPGRPDAGGPACPPEFAEFLPVEPGTPDADTGTGIETGNDMIDDLLVISRCTSSFGVDLLAMPFVHHALTQAGRYFKGTNVIAYGVVALHDDDILEDLGNCFDKDPVQLGPPVAREGLGQFSDLGHGKVGAGSGYVVIGDFMDTLRLLFYQLSLKDLVNRRIEVVKLVVPLQGLTREHPLLGRLSEDAQNQVIGWGINPLSTAAGPLAGLAGIDNDAARALAGLAQRLGLDMLPRHFVVYVKQRLVLLDLIFYLLEVLQVVLEFVFVVQDIAAVTAGADSSGNAMFNMSDSGAGADAAGASAGMALGVQLPMSVEYRQAFEAQPPERQAMARAVLLQPEIQETIIKAAGLTDSDLLVPGRGMSYREQLAQREAALAGSGVDDPDQRRRLALDQVGDAYAAEYQGFQILQVFTAVQPPDEANLLVERIAVAGAGSGETTLADELVAEGPAIFEDKASRAIYAEVRADLGARKVKDLVPEANTELTVKEVLNRSPSAAERLLGAEALGALRTRLSAERNAAIDGSKVLSKGIPDDLAAWVEREVAAGRTASEAVERVKTASATSAEDKAALTATSALLRTRGNDARVIAKLKRVRR